LKRFAQLPTLEKRRHKFEARKNSQKSSFFKNSILLKSSPKLEIPSSDIHLSSPETQKTPSNLSKASELKG
jgi:hypothetical protein